MADVRVFVITGPDDWKAMAAFLREQAPAAARRGRPLEVRVFEHRPKRTTAQNALLWALLEIVSRSVIIEQRRYDAESWHEQFKRELLPEETAKGVKKWRYLPNGDRELFMGTSDLDSTEMSDYIDRFLAMATTVFGAEFPTPPP